MMNEKMKNFLFEKYFEDNNMGILIVNDRKVKYINKSYKILARLFDTDMEKTSPVDIYFNYEKYLEKNTHLRKLKDLFDSITIFRFSKTDMTFTHVEEFNSKFLEFKFKGVIIDNEKYYIITVLDVTNEIKLLDYKYLEISKKIGELSFRELSKENFNSKIIYENIHLILKEYNIVNELAISILKGDKIYIEFGIIDGINLTGKKYSIADKSLTSYIINYNKRIYIPNSLNFKLPYGYKIFHIGSKPKPYSVYGVPLRNENGKAYGAILYERPEECKFNSFDFKFLDEVTYTIQSVIRFNKLYKELHNEKTKYYEISIRDHLTRAYNRSFLEEYLKKIYNRSKRYKERVILSFIDIDNFKKINDKYGHDYGDMCLTVFSETVFSNIRESDVFARYGGDEFVIVFPNTTFENSEKVMKRIKRKLKRTEFPIDISFGLTEIDINLSLKENMKKVDDLMYQMKKIKNTGTK
ncbi:hypothetical protein XO12_08650 [Marinitoga sp. 1154]|uniref:GGDEF domain-containing protein n=1 Tax=Marinitoga sp. 1154 TaxID=1643335 RepID=UPI001586E168|nr:GGDEF domain-containing protein [Marinitoga sp. 1154]NUV00153.1 hypothetical protein [Marinitoga sp. 1154]